LDFLIEGALATLGWWLLRSREWAPRWATTRGALAALLVFQALTDVVGSARGGVKPSACASPTERT
jgi:hypothetical protein